jgi:glycosyltransferase involved in cell wall biosynthesis
LFERTYLNRAAFLHAVSRSDSTGLLAYGARSRIVIAPNCIDERALPMELDPAFLGRRFPQLHRRRVLMYLGRLDPVVKGLDLLLRAWAQTRGHSEMGLLLVGPDWRGSRARLQNLARRLRVADSVFFLGRASGSEKWNLLASADVLVHPSRSEGAPFAILEAMLAGKPVLVSEAADPDGLISRYRAGLVVGSESTSLVTALEHLSRLTDEDLRAMGASGRQLVAREFRWEDAARTLLTAYEEALDTGASRLV